MLEIVYRQERDRKNNWEIGARVLEAIGVAFSKGHKYSEEPQLLTKEEQKEKQRKAFMDFAERVSHMKFNGVK